MSESPIKITRNTPITPGCIDMFFRSGDRQAEIDWDTGVKTECSYAEETIERHWWTRGYSYKWRILRALKAEDRIKQREAQAKRADIVIADLEKALQGMLDWYEDDNGEGFCECDKSVDLTCRACVARTLLPATTA